jgi:D-alanyl-D-alanine carboxypeptidase/D-alanyl-D-alanine-endopeptidase (penicillin-binding protein 4)
VPFIVSDYDIAQMLEDTLGRPVQVLYDQELRSLPFIRYSSARDTLLKRMMQVSDNFIAEQLLMQCAFYMRGTFESDSAIAVAQEMIFGGSPDSLHWVDGSGLSRYNLLTPRSLVWILDQVRILTSMEYVTSVFPSGGFSGTLENWYHHPSPYVYAKTGTLRNQHCLSGYLKTDSGRWLIFSFMHNHFPGESSEVKHEMERILLQIKASY